MLFVAPWLLAAAVTALYLPAVVNGFVYDDHEVILAQPRPQSAMDLLHVFVEPHFRGLPYYRPIARASLLAEKAVHGDWAAPFHVANALLAGGAAAAAFTVLRSPGLAVGAWPALLAAAAFAVHPIASSCVYPIASGRETLLPSLIILAAAAAWLRARLWLARALLVVALLAKEMAVALPFIFAWADLCGVAAGCPPVRLSAGRLWVRRHVGGFVIVVAYLGWRHLMFGGGEWTLAVLDDPVGPSLSLLFALQSALTPFAALHYEPEVAAWLSPVRSTVALVALAALVLAVRIVRAPPTRVASFWGGWFVLAQLATANLLRQEARFDERYVFLALLSIPAVVAGMATRLCERPPLRRAFAAAGVAVVVGLGAVSVGRAAAFRDDTTFASAWVASDPGAPEPHHLLGRAAADESRFDEALGHYQQVLALAPATADLHYNIASVLAAQGRSVEARAHVEDALRLDPGHPEAHALLGALLDQAGDLDAAIEHYRSSLRSDPGFAVVHGWLGAALARRGDRAEAVTHLREAVRLDPSLVQARQLLDSLEPDPSR